MKESGCKKRGINYIIIVKAKKKEKKHHCRNNNKTIRHTFPSRGGVEAKPTGWSLAVKK
jgi:hypothetical protein